ncbi:MAG: alpha/beta fold hydrolase [Actinomycetota bacterium]|nr:alpha/beta fold hydrolase [Actinomycetota bacterium]
MTRRAIAAVATAGLLLVGVPAAVTPASAATACALGATCEGSLEGSLGASPFKIQMPSTFNGTVLIYNHGYRFSGPIPAAFAGPTALALSTNPAYTAISVPAFATAFGSSVAYQANNMAQVAQNDKIAAGLLAQGYALAGLGYSAQGWAIAEALQANENMIKYVNGGGVAGVKKIMVWGDSFGGYVSATVAERNPGKVAGVLPTCAPLAGPEQAMQSAMTVMFTWKTLIAPTLRVANYQSYTQALSDLATVLSTLGAVGAGTASTSAVGYPIAQANLLGGLMGGLPTKSAVYDGQTVNPMFATLGTAAGLAGGYSPASAGASSAAAMLQNVGAAAALGIMVRYDLEQRARALGQIPATESANFTDNVGVTYTELLSSEQRGEFGDTLNATAVMPNALNAMLAKLDESKGNAAARFPASAAALKAVRSLPAPKGVYKVPTLLISTTFDPVVPAGNTENYYLKLHSKQGNRMVKALQFYTSPPEDGWTTFDAGAKSPNSAASAAKATSGVGHCNWAIDNGIQMINAVTALNRLVNAKTVKQIKAINRLMWSTPGVNSDGAFVPEPLKRPGLTVS